MSIPQGQIDYLVRELIAFGDIYEKSIHMDWGNASIECTDSLLKSILVALAKDYRRLRELELAKMTAILSEEEMVKTIQKAFLDGETPSALMSKICKNYGDRSDLHFTVSGIFRKAFNVDLVRASHYTKWHPDLSNAEFNHELLPKMVIGLKELGVDLNGTWLEGIEIQSLRKHREGLSAEGPSGIEDTSWNYLSHKDQNYVNNLVAFKNYSWQVMKLLSKFAEMLQMKNQKKK